MAFLSKLFLVATALTSLAVAAPIQQRQSGPCEGSGETCVGDITYWDGGMGACGWSVDTNNDMVIALPYELMGTLSNDNPYCGRNVTIVDTALGTTTQATVADKCMGCENYAIDLTEVLFNTVTQGTGNGRVTGIEWYFTD